jgi:hypothetical protein
MYGMANLNDISKKIALTIELEGAYGADSNIVSNTIMDLLVCKYKIDIAYRSFADRVTGPWRDALVDHWQEHAEEEREHAYDLAMKLMGMGVDPNITNVSLNCASDLPSLCKCLVDMELELIAKARQLCEISGDNTALRVLGENIALTDTQHLDDLRRMCGVHLG